MALAPLVPGLMGEEVAGEEQDVGWAFGEAAHEPRIPEGAIGNQDAGWVAGLREADLFGALNSVEHLKFNLVLGHALRDGPFDQLGDK